MAKILNFIFIIILLGAIGFISYRFYELTPGEKQNLTIFLTQQELPESNASTELVMFMPNMRFDTNSLSYYFLDCEPEKQQRVLEAFSIVSTETKVINFYEIGSEKDAKIKIYCSDVKNPTRNNSFVAGEGGPDILINLSLYPLIQSGQIYLYGTQRKTQCDYPIVEIHELMHVFGFDHLQDKSTILYPYISCDQRMTSEISTELARLYLIEPRADLLITNATASKGGIYLNFQISIHNRGLISATKTEIELYDISDNKKIGNFSMQTLEPGMTTTLTLQNFILPSRGTNNLKFKITTRTPEYFYENNEFIAQL